MQTTTFSSWLCAYALEKTISLGNAFLTFYERDSSLLSINWWCSLTAILQSSPESSLASLERNIGTAFFISSLTFQRILGRWMTKL
jgi:hypothetical protein